MKTAVPIGAAVIIMSCSGRKVVFVKSSMLVVRITKNPCKAWYIAAYIGILYPVQRLPWQTNSTFFIENPRFRWGYYSTNLPRGQELRIYSR